MDARPADVRPKPILGNCLGAARQACGLTLKAVAARTGIALSTLVQGGKPPDVADLRQAASAQRRAGDRRAVPSAGQPLSARPGSVARAGEGQLVQTELYSYLYQCTDLLGKRMVPIMAEVTDRTLDQFGPLMRHAGKEFFHVLQGRVAVHTEFYATAFLEAGNGIYLDSGMAYTGRKRLAAATLYKKVPGRADAAEATPTLNVQDALPGLRRHAEEPAAAPQDVASRDPESKHSSGADPHKAGSLGQDLNLSHGESAPTRDMGERDGGGKYSRRAPLLSDKAGLEREGQAALFDRSAPQAQQARDDAGGLQSRKDQRPADELPLFDRMVRDQPELFGLRRFHGTPQDFDHFDMSKIGTGEGAQAFGHGLYFAQSEKVAQHYRDALSQRGPSSVQLKLPD